MRDHLTGTEALVPCSRTALDAHRASGVCPGCRARMRTEAVRAALRDVLATRGTDTREETGNLRLPTQARLL